MRSCPRARTYSGSTEDEKKPADFHNCRGAAADRLPGGLRGPAAGGAGGSGGTDRAAAHSDPNAGTYVCTDAEIAEKGMDCKTFDYYIVLEETEANMAFIRDTFGTADRAGYTY